MRGDYVRTLLLRDRSGRHRRGFVALALSRSEMVEFRDGEPSRLTCSAPTESPRAPDERSAPWRAGPQSDL
jgi:hypothetical protein